jgi:pectin methylesterase-like acyl-CoA thioesterase
MSCIILRALTVTSFAVLLTPGDLFGLTVVVGASACQPGFAHYSTIQAAASAVPAGGTLLVCPGTYPEQIQVTTPLTLRGVTMGNSDAAVIVPPTGGLTTNAVDEFGTPLALQLW